MWKIGSTTKAPEVLSKQKRNPWTRAMSFFKIWKKRLKLGSEGSLGKEEELDRPHGLEPLLIPVYSMKLQ